MNLSLLKTQLMKFSIGAKGVRRSVSGLVRKLKDRLEFPLWLDSVPVRLFHRLSLAVALGATFSYLCFSVSIRDEGKVPPDRPDPGPIVEVQKKRPPSRIVDANPGPDADGDGIPDSWETQFGLNPNKAADADSDFDRDGLTALEEYGLHTKTSGASGNPRGIWTLETLPTPPGFTSISSRTLIDCAGNGTVLIGVQGILTGTSTSKPYPFTYNPATEQWTLVLPPAAYSTANLTALDVNSKGQVVGYFTSGTTRGFVWTPDQNGSGSSTLYYVNPGPSQESAYPKRISDNGYMIAVSTVNGRSIPVDPAGKELNFHSSWTNTILGDVNDYGEFVGVFYNPAEDRYETFLAIDGGGVYLTHVDAGPHWLEAPFPFSEMPDFDLEEIDWVSRYDSGEPGYGWVVDHNTGELLEVMELADQRVVWNIGDPYNQGSDQWVDYPEIGSSPNAINSWGEFTAGVWTSAILDTFDGSFFFDGEYHYLVHGNGMSVSDDARVLYWNGPYGIWCDSVRVELSDITPSGSLTGMTTGRMAGDASVVVQKNSNTLLRLTGVQDEDEDGIPNDWEDLNGLNKNLAGDGHQDPDGDGTNNIGEFRQGSNPHLAPAYDEEGNEIDLRPGIDTDSDGIPNPWEWVNGLDYQDPADAPLDFDRDDYSNLQEYRLGTDPRGAPLYRIQEIGPLDGASVVDTSSFELGNAIAEGSEVTDPVTFLATPTASGSGGRRPAVWTSSRADDSTSCTFYPSHGSQGTSLLARAPSGAAFATHSSNPASFVYWESASATPVTVSGAGGAADAAYLYSVKISPGGKYVVAGRQRASNPAVYEPVLWKMPVAGVTFQPVRLTDPFGVTGTAWSTFHVNDHGQVVGSGYVGGQQRPVVWRMNASGNAIASSGAVDLLSGSSTATASGISNLEDAIIAGTSIMSGGAQHATVWKVADGSATDLGVPEGAYSSFAEKVSPSGLIAGYSSTLSGGFGSLQLFLGAKNAGDGTWRLQSQGSPVGYLAIYQVNDAGEIRGYCAEEGYTGALAGNTLWSHGRAHSLANILPPSSGYVLSSFRSMSESGAMIVHANTASGPLYLLLTPDQDTDGDGLADSFEDLHGLGAFSARSANADPDLDQLSDLDEYRNGTNPQEKDTDSDGMLDGWEVRYGLLPNDRSDAGLDPDGDQVNNLLEFQLDTSPIGEYKIERQMTGDSYHPPYYAAAADSGRLVHESGGWIEDYYTDPNDLPVYTSTAHFVVAPPVSGTPLPLPPARFVQVADEYTPEGYQLNETPQYRVDESTGKVNGTLTRSIYPYDTFEWETERFFIPDAAANLDEEDWIPWSDVEEALRASGGPGMGTGEFLLPSTIVSPSGTKRIHRTTGNLCYVLDESGAFIGSLPFATDWQFINDSGAALAMVPRTVAASGGVPSYVAPDVRLRLNSSSSYTVTLPHDPGVTPVYQIRFFSNDGRAVVSRQLTNLQGSSYDEYYVVDAFYGSGSVRKLEFALSGQSGILALSNLNGRLTGGGTEGFHMPLDGTNVFFKNLPVRITPTASRQPLSELYQGHYVGSHVASGGRLTVTVYETDYDTTLLQLVPDNDWDDDGLPDDWEKYWAKHLQETLPNPDPGMGENLDPGAIYGSSGQTVGQSFFSYQESEDESNDQNGVFLAKQTRSLGGIFEEYQPGVVAAECSVYAYPTLMGIPNSKWIYGSSIVSPGDVTDSALVDLLSDEYPWSDLDFTNHIEGGDGDTFDIAAYYWRPSSTYKETSFTQAQYWLGREQPVVVPTSKSYVELSKFVPYYVSYFDPPEGPLPWKVVGVTKRTVPKNELWAPTPIGLAPTTYVHATTKYAKIEPLEPHLEVLSPEFPIAAAEGPASHRKISLFATPVKDSAPEDGAETDTPPEETYVDAWDRSLRFRTSFAWIPQGSSDLPLAVTMDYNPTSMTLVKTQTFDPVTKKPNGFREALSASSKVLTGGFGVGFSSNLSAGVSVEAVVSSYKDKEGHALSRIDRYKVDVIDSDGVPHKFFSANLASFRPETGPVAAAEAPVIGLRWDANRTHLILTQKYGKTTTYVWTGAPVQLPTRDPQGPGDGKGYTEIDLHGATLQGYAKIEKVEDRYGNRLMYVGTSEGLEIRHFHPTAAENAPSGVLKIGMSGGMVRSITDPRDKVTRFVYTTRQIHNQLKFPVLSKAILPDGSVREFGMNIDFRKPKSYYEKLEKPEPTDIFSYGAPKPKKKKKQWITGNSVESAIAPYLAYVKDGSGRVTSFSYDEPLAIDSAKLVTIKGTLDLTKYENLEVEEGNTAIGWADVRDEAIRDAKIEISPDIVEEMAMRGYFKIPSPRANNAEIDPTNPFRHNMPGEEDPYNDDPYQNAEGIYYRYGLTSSPAVNKVTSSDINGDGRPEIIEIGQEDRTEDLLREDPEEEDFENWATGIDPEKDESPHEPTKVIRTTTVSDGIGSTLYTFGDALVVSYANQEVHDPNEGPVTDIFKVQPQMEGAAANTTTAAFIVRRLEIARGGAKETYFFRPDAGMAIGAAIDASGNRTVYNYTDPFPELPGGVDLVISGKAVSDGPNAIHQLQQFHSDPTSETRWERIPSAEQGEGGEIFRIASTRSYEYSDDWRLRTTAVNEKGVTTVQTLDLAHHRQRTEQKVYPGDPDETSPIREEYWQYNDSRFPKFVSKHIVKDLGSPGDPSWVGDLVTEFEADDFGRLEKQKVQVSDGVFLETKYSYDPSGNRTKITSPRNLETSFTYDVVGRLQSVTYADTRVKSFQYDAAGRKSAEIDERGNRTSFKYSPGGFPTETRRHMTDSVNPGASDIVTRSEFDSRGRLIAKIDGNGNRTETQYDSLDRVVLVRDAAGNETLFDYDLSLNSGGSLFDSSGFKPTRIRDARGFLTATTYNYLYLPIAVGKEYKLPSGDWRTRTPGATGGGNFLAVTRTAYDVTGNPTDTWTRREGTSADLDPELDLDSYKATAELKAEISHTEVEYDDLGRAWRTTVEPEDSNLKSISETLFTSTGLAWQSTSFKNMTGSLERVTETEYDGAGRATKVWSPHPDTGLVVKSPAASASACVETHYDADGNVSYVIDARGKRTDFSYDARNRQEETLAPWVTDYSLATPASVRPRTFTEYDAAGNVFRITGPRGDVTQNEYDRANRVVATTVALGEDEAATSSQAYDSNGNVVLATDANLNETRNQYDVLNRLVATVVNPVTGQPSANFADPAADDVRVVNQYDEMGNLIRVADGMAEKSFSGTTWSITESGGHVTGFTYDGLGRNLTQVWDIGTSVARTTTWEYDALVTKASVDALSRRIEFLYDALMRPTRETHVGDTSNQGTKLFSYQGTAAFIPGTTTNTYTSGPGPMVACWSIHTSALFRELAEVFYTHDRAGRLTSEVSAGEQHHYWYDIAGNRTLVAYANTGRKLVSKYDDLGRVHTIIDTTNSVADPLTYTAQMGDKETIYRHDAAGGIVRKSLPNGTVTTNRYDLRGRLLKTETKDASGLNTLSGSVYGDPLTLTGGYDAVGNVLRVVESYDDLDDREIRNTYDHCYRLSTEQDTGSDRLTTYGYDAANNRVSRLIQDPGQPDVLNRYVFGTPEISFNTNQLVGIGTDNQANPIVGAANHFKVRYTYDANGNRLTRDENPDTAGQVDNYYYDYLNRLNRLTFLSGDTAANGDYYFNYDSRSRRTRLYRSGWTGTARISFSGGLSVQEYTYPGTTLTREIIRGSDMGGGIGGILYSKEPSTTNVFNHYNSRGDVVSQTNSSGGVTWEAKYEAFGTRTEEDGNPASRQRANTKDEDPTGLLNEGMRYRDLEAGVFITRDPAGFEDGPNVYTYVRQNPWTMFDPLGLKSVKDTLEDQQISYEEARDLEFEDGEAEAILDANKIDKFTVDEVRRDIVGKDPDWWGGDEFIQDRNWWPLEDARYYKDWKSGKTIDEVVVTETAKRNQGLAKKAIVAEFKDEKLRKLIKVAEISTHLMMEGSHLVIPCVGAAAAKLGTVVTTKMMTAPAEMATNVVSVSRWGRPGLEPGDFVMKGPANRWNYFKSGKWQPGMGNRYTAFKAGEEFVVPKSTLVSPSKAATATAADKGLAGWIKEVMGQRAYKPPSQ